MKNIKYVLSGAALIAVLLLAEISSPVVAAVQASGRLPEQPTAQSTAQTPAQTTDATTDFTLSNQVKTIHRRVDGNEVVAIQIYFRGGARSITEQNAGIEELLLEVAGQGTRKYSKSEINRELARMGTVIDSAAGYDFSVIAMRCVRSNFDRSWALLTEMVLNPLFDEKEVALAKDQLLNGLRQQNDTPEPAVAILASKLLYATHPYRNSPSGTIESVGRLTAADMKAHHARMLEGGRMLVVAVGNIGLDEVKKKVEAGFGALPKGSFRNEPVPALSHSSAPEFQIVDKSVATNYIRGTFAAPPLNHPDYPAFSVTVNILQQILFQEVRVKRNLSYGAEVTLLSNAANSAFIGVTTPKPNETLRVIFDQIDFMQRQVLLAEPLKSIIGSFLTQYYTKLETNDAQAARLAEYELQGGDWRRLMTWMEETGRVTPEDIQRVSRAYLKNFHIAAIGNPSQFDRDLYQSR